MRTKSHKVIILFEPDPAKRTVWHSPNGDVIRGPFSSTEEAVEWTRKNIPGFQYGLRTYETEMPDPLTVDPSKGEGGPLAAQLQKWAKKSL